MILLRRTHKDHNSRVMKTPTHKKFILKKDKKEKYHQKIQENQVKEQTRKLERKQPQKTRHKERNNL